MATKRGMILRDGKVLNIDEEKMEIDVTSDGTENPQASAVGEPPALSPGQDDPRVISNAGAGSPTAASSSNQTAGFPARTRLSDQSGAATNQLPLDEVVATTSTNTAMDSATVGLSHPISNAADTNSHVALGYLTGNAGNQEPTGRNDTLPIDVPQHTGLGKHNSP